MLKYLFLNHSWLLSSYISLVCGSSQYILYYVVFVVRRTQRDYPIRPLLHWCRVQFINYYMQSLIQKMYHLYLFYYFFARLFNVWAPFPRLIDFILNVLINE